MAGPISDKETLKKIEKCICIKCYCYRGISVTIKQHFFGKLVNFFKILFFRFWRKNCKGCELPVVNFEECSCCPGAK